MSTNYDTPHASVSWIEETGQTEYTVTWHGDLWLSGVNLNDGTEWTSPAPVEDPDRFGLVTTVAEFFVWCARFQDTGTPVEEAHARQRAAQGPEVSASSGTVPGRGQG